MLGGWLAGGIWLSTEPTDMRRSFDGLCSLISTHLGGEPGERAPVRVRHPSRETGRCRMACSCLP